MFAHRTEVITSQTNDEEMNTKFEYFKEEVAKLKSEIEVTKRNIEALKEANEGLEISFKLDGETTKDACETIVKKTTDSDTF